MQFVLSVILACRKSFEGIEWIALILRNLGIAVESSARIVLSWYSYKVL